MLTDRSGNIAIMAALCMPLILGVMALGIDYGNLTLQNREIQASADMASIVASSNIAAPEQAVLNYFTTNGMKLGVRSGTQLLTAAGSIAYDAKTVFNGRDGYASVTKGHYVADPAVASGSRFQAGTLPYDAVQVQIVAKGTLYFGQLLTAAPTMGATGTAAVEKVAGISIGSRAASLNGGVLNSLLGGLLGTTISLSLVDYNNLINADVNLLKFLDLLATEVGITAGSYNDLLATNISYPTLLKALGKSADLTPALQTIVNNLQKTVNKTTVNLNLGEILKLGPVGAKVIGQGDTLSIKTDVFGLINAAAVAGNNGNQLNLDLGAGVPGLLTAKVSLAIGEPPAATPSSAVGGIGTIVRTPQTRLLVEVQTGGIGDLLGLKIRVPLYVEVAYAEGKLSDIRCAGTGKQNGDVDVQVVPGVAEITLGDVDPAAFSHFGTAPRVTRATIVSSGLLSISALASVDTGNLAAKTVTFSAADIAAGKVITVSSSNTLTALVQTLLGTLQLRIDLLGLPLVIPQVLLQTLATLLSGITAPLDSLLFNLLAVLGVHIGEADVRALGVSCVNPALVQ